MKQVRDGAPDKWSRSGWGQKRYLAWLGAFGFFCTIAQGLAQESLPITFEGPPPQPPGTGTYIQQYSESGMLFTPLASFGFGRNGGGRTFSPENGTAYLQATLGDSLQFSLLDGSVFDLLSADLAEYSLAVPNPVAVPFVGYRADGSVVNTSFITDGVIDGTGPIADFQTFYFGPEFSGLTRVEIPTYGWSLDNVVVSVPEPAVGTLLLIGGLLVLGIRYSGCRR